MQIIVKLSLIGTMIFAFITSLLIGVESLIFGFFLMPVIVVCTIIFILGSVQSKEKKRDVGGGI